MYRSKYIWNNLGQQNLGHQNFQSKQSILHFFPTKLFIFFQNDQVYLKEPIWKSQYLGSPIFFYIFQKADNLNSILDVSNKFLLFCIS